MTGKVRQAEKRVMAAAELLVGAAAGHPSRPSARRSYWESLEAALDEMRRVERSDCKCINGPQGHIPHVCTRCWRPTTAQQEAQR